MQSNLIYDFLGDGRPSGESFTVKLEHSESEFQSELFKL